MRGEQIREMLKRGQRIYGTHVCSLTNPVTAKMETAVEMDFAFICNEHMPIDRTETSMMCQFYAAHGIVPVVRVPTVIRSGQPWRWTPAHKASACRTWKKSTKCGRLSEP